MSNDLITLPLMARLMLYIAYPKTCPYKASWLSCGRNARLARASVRPSVPYGLPTPKYKGIGKPKLACTFPGHASF